jgi:polar amino acid transport system permease protein
VPVIRWVDLMQFLPDLLKGARYTIVLTFVIMAISIVAAIFVALARMSRFRLLRLPMIAYVEFIRGTPGLMQLYYIFYVFPFFGLTLPAIAAGIIGMSINYTAYLSEVYRAGITSVPKTQMEAAESLGMSYWQAMRLVILPQAARVVLPPTVNYLLGLFKDTSLLSVITIQELMFTGILLGATTYKYLTIFTEVAVLYFIICYPWALLATWVERKMKAVPEPAQLKKRKPFGLSSGPLAPA